MLSRIIEWLRRLLARLGGRDGVEEPDGRRAVGEFSPPEEERRDYPPNQGFALAIKDALDNKMNDWPKGKKLPASVKFSADVSVTNPGQIDTYRVTFDR